MQPDIHLKIGKWHYYTCDTKCHKRCSVLLNDTTPLPRYLLENLLRPSSMLIDSWLRLLSIAKIYESLDPHLITSVEYNLPQPLPSILAFEVKIHQPLVTHKPPLPWASFIVLTTWSTHQKEGSNPPPFPFIMISCGSLPRGVHCTKHVRVYVSAQKGY